MVLSNAEREQRFRLQKFKIAARFLAKIGNLDEKLTDDKPRSSTHFGKGAQHVAFASSR